MKQLLFSFPTSVKFDSEFVNKEKYGRAPSVTKQILESCSDINNIPEKYKVNFERNQKLLDFEFIPQNIVDKILQSYKIEPIGNKKKLYEYFFKNKKRDVTLSLKRWRLFSLIKKAY